MDMDEERNPEVPERKNRRPIIVGVAIVAVAVLAIGGVYGYRAYEGHKMSVARQACQSAVADQTKAVKAYRALLGSDGIVAALRTDVKSVKDARTVDTLSKAAEAELPAMVRCDASTVSDLAAASTSETSPSARSSTARMSYGPSPPVTSRAPEPFRTSPTKTPSGI